MAQVKLEYYHKHGRSIVDTRPTESVAELIAAYSVLSTAILPITIIDQNTRYPCTAGQFYEFRGTIRHPVIYVYSSSISRRHTLAHELGHAFHFMEDRKDYRKSGVWAKEVFADDFAELLLNDPTYPRSQYEDYARMIARRG